MKFYDPKTVATPGASYHQSVEIPAGARILYISGQVGQRPDGTNATGIEEQSEVVWQNISAILADAGMGIENLIKINSYLVKPEDFAKYGAVRGKFLNGHRPASTSAIVLALANPAWLVEVEAVAAKA